MVAVGTLLGWTYNDAHFNHVHVEPPVDMTGVPPFTNPGMTAGIKAIYDALVDEFGPTTYFAYADHHWEDGKYVLDDPDYGWTHMGGWNRRYVGSGTTWSQHAWWNALDIGPYYYEDQQPFIDFLKGVEVPQFTEHEEMMLKWLVKEFAEGNTNPDFLNEGNLIRDIRKNLITKDELDAALAKLPAGGTVDADARASAAEALSKLSKVKSVL